MILRRRPIITIEEINKLIKGSYPGNLTNDISDGSHTFGDLYYHRTVLFASILNSHSEKAWKSHKQENGEMFDGYFLAGIMTPKGQYTYHCEMKYWDLFEVKEYEVSPVAYDGHQPSEVIRLLSLN